VISVGQLIGLMVGETAQAAAAAAKLIKITYEDLPAVLSIDDAIASASFFPVRACLSSSALFSFFFFCLFVFC
jgi:xanthine dehydrogenase molybdopterin-binding subunit B